MSQPVPPYTDPIPPSTNQYRLLLTQYHYISYSKVRLSLVDLRWAELYVSQVQEPFKIFEWLSMTFLTSFLKTDTLVMENNCPSDREELNSETSTIHKSILCLEVSVQTDSHLWMDLFQVRRQVVWAARLQESLSWLVYCPPQLTLILFLRFFNEKYCWCI